MFPYVVITLHRKHKQYPSQLPMGQHNKPHVTWRLTVQCDELELSNDARGFYKSKS